MSKIVLEDFNKGDGYYKVNLAYLSKEQVEEIEALVSKWSPTDEDIKSCIGMCLTDVNEQRFKDYGTNLKDCLAWLKRQGIKPQGKTALEAIHEQKADNANKVEPNLKIEEGKYYVCIRNLDDRYGTRAFRKGVVYYSPKNGSLEPDNSNVPFAISCAEHYFRPWTVEDAKDGDILYSPNLKLLWFFKSRDTVYCGCNLNYNDGAICGEGYFERPTDAIPATKEQRDILFQKMREKGYEWDADKKELKKIDNEEFNGEDYGIDSLYHAQRILEKTLGKVDGYQSDDGILEHECAITAVKKLYEQKPAEWSEEDDYNVQCLIAKVVSDIQKGNVSRNQELIDWLQSLKERAVWKPSEEQLYWLNELYEQLNKLKEK